MTPRPHQLDDCWCGQSHHEQVLGRGDDPRVRPTDSLAESQPGLNDPSGSLNPRPGRDTTHTCTGCDATMNIADWPTAIYHEGCPNDGMWIKAPVGFEVGYETVKVTERKGYLIHATFVIEAASADDAEEAVRRTLLNDDLAPRWQCERTWWSGEMGSLEQAPT